MTIKNILRAEYLLFLVIFSYLASLNPVFGYWSLLIFWFPDISFIGYLFGPKTGAFSYNLAHNYIPPCIILLIAYFVNNEILIHISFLHLAHISLDRMLGYGLKYPKGFRYTHLGEIGKKRD